MTKILDEWLTSLEIVQDIVLREVERWNEPTDHESRPHFWRNFQAVQLEDERGQVQIDIMADRCARGIGEQDPRLLQSGVQIACVKTESTRYQVESRWLTPLLKEGDTLRLQTLELLGELGHSILESSRGHDRADEWLRAFLENPLISRVPVADEAGSIMANQASRAQRNASNAANARHKDAALENTANVRQSRSPSGAPSLPANVWAREQVHDKGRAPKDIYDEWLSRRGVDARNLVDPHKSFAEAIRLPRRRKAKKPKK